MEQMQTWNIGLPSSGFFFSAAGQMFFRSLSCLLFVSGGNQNIECGPHNTVDSQDANVLYRRSHVPGGQCHNALKSGLGRDKVAEERQRSADPDQGAHQGHRDKHKHDDLDIDHADHQALGELADKQPDQRRHEG